MALPQHNPPKKKKKKKNRTKFFLNARKDRVLAALLVLRERYAEGRTRTTDWMFCEKVSESLSYIHVIVQVFNHTEDSDYLISIKICRQTGF